jgi:Holliday junction resolvase RusA-like endonuclease
MNNDTPVCTITVAGHPVSVNTMYATASNGRRYLTKAARAWKRIVRDEAWVAWLQRPRRNEHLITETFRVRCTFFGVRSDVDNLLKCTLDGLKKAIGVDDRYFVEVKAQRGKRPAKATQGAIIDIWADSVESLFGDATPFLEPDAVAAAGRAVDRAIAKGMAHIGISPQLYERSI